MKKRKNLNRKKYLCSGLVYCQCGANVRPYADKNGHTYHYYVCSKRCGSPVVQEEEVNSAAKNLWKNF